MARGFGPSCRRSCVGLGRFFARVSPNTRMILADPKGSVLAEIVNSGPAGEAGSWVVEGIGEDFVPPVCDLSFVGATYTIDDRESLTAGPELLRRGRPRRILDWNAAGRRAPLLSGADRAQTRRHIGTGQR